MSGAPSGWHKIGRLIGFSCCSDSSPGDQDGRRRWRGSLRHTREERREDVDSSSLETRDTRGKKDGERRRTGVRAREAGKWCQRETRDAGDDFDREIAVPISRYGLRARVRACATASE